LLHFDVTGLLPVQVKLINQHVFLSIMEFEEFEKKILAKSYGIAAMNHYSLGGKLHTYCVVFKKSTGKAFQSEAQDSKEVFEDIYRQMMDDEGR